MRSPATQSDLIESPIDLKFSPTGQRRHLLARPLTPTCASQRAGPAATLPGSAARLRSRYAERRARSRRPVPPSSPGQRRPSRAAPVACALGSATLRRAAANPSHASRSARRRSSGSAPPSSPRRPELHRRLGHRGERRDSTPQTGSASCAGLLPTLSCESECPAGEAPARLRRPPSRRPELHRRFGHLAGRGVYRVGRGVYPAGRGVYRVGRGVYQAGRGVSQAGRGVYRVGRGVYPAGRGVYQAGRGVSPAGRAVYQVGRGVPQVGRASHPGVRVDRL